MAVLQQLTTYSSYMMFLRFFLKFDRQAVRFFRAAAVVSITNGEGRMRVKLSSLIAKFLTNDVPSPRLQV